MRLPNTASSSLTAVKATAVPKRIFPTVYNDLKRPTGAAAALRLYRRAPSFRSSGAQTRSINLLIELRVLAALLGTGPTNRAFALEPVTRRHSMRYHRLKISGGLAAHRAAQHRRSNDRAPGHISVDGGMVRLLRRAARTAFLGADASATQYLGNAARSPITISNTNATIAG